MSHPSKMPKVEAPGDLILPGATNEDAERAAALEELLDATAQVLVEDNVRLSQRQPTENLALRIPHEAAAPGVQYEVQAQCNTFKSYFHIVLWCVVAGA